MRKIGAAGGDAGVNLGDAKPLVVAPVAALLRSGQPALLPLEVLDLALEVERVARFPAVASDRHILDSQVHADRLARHQQRLNLHFATEADEIPPVRRLAHRCHFRRARRNLAPSNLERPQLGQFQKFAGLVSAVDLSPVKLVAHRLPVVARLEAGVLATPLEEIFERPVLVDRRFGQAPRRRIGQPSRVGALPVRNHPVQRHVIVPGFVGLPRLAAQFQRPVPDEPRVAEIDP